MEIDKDLPNIEDLIENNLVVKIIGRTGIGKTTNLPKYLGKKYKVTVVVSNNVESLNNLKFPNVKYVLAKDFSKEIHKDFSKEIHKDFSKEIHKDFSKEIHKDFSKEIHKEQEILIIDELDSGSIDNFLIISLWKKYSNSKLILVSNLKHSLFPDFPTYTIKSYHYSEVRYLKDFKNFTEQIPELIDLVYNSHNSSIEGDFLIFALRKKSVDNIIEKLKYVLEDVEDVEIYSSYNIVPEMYKESEKRKIIVSGSSGKTSLTLKNVTCIFDLMRERRLVPTLTGGYIDSVEYISKRDADLRAKKSRKKAIVYRFISENSFEKLPETTDELLFRIPLHHLMLDLYARKLNPFEILFSFETEKLTFIYNLLLKYGLLDITNKVTEKGKLARKLSFGIRPTIIVLENMTYSSLVVASLIDKYMKSPFILTEGFDKYKKTFEYKLNYDEHIKIYFNRFRGISDVESLYLVWNEWYYSKEDLEKWCKNNYIDYEYMRNVKIGIENIKDDIIKDDGINDTIKDDTMKNLYEDRKYLLDLNRTIISQYYDNKGFPYKPDALSINKIEENRPTEVYGIITSNFEDLNSLILTYVSPTTGNQQFVSSDVTY